jgi:toxin ParE1/3/4
MAPMRVAWTRQALRDLDPAFEYTAEHDPGAAPAIIERIETALAAIADLPHAGRRGRVDGTRELVVTGTPYIIPYRLRRGRIELLALIHGARRWPDHF